MKHRIEHDAQAHLTARVGASALVDQALDIDFFEELEPGVIVGGPDQTRIVAVAIAQFDGKAGMLGDGGEQADLDPGRRSVAQDAQVFTPVDDQLGGADEQRKARRGAQFGP
jgi:hypothetical protein